LLSLRISVLDEQVVKAAINSPSENNDVEADAGVRHVGCGSFATELTYQHYLHFVPAQRACSGAMTGAQCPTLRGAIGFTESMISEPRAARRRDG
jgi:hypothetical protein